MATKQLTTILEISCKCGWYREEVEAISWTQAEVIADRHESSDIRHHSSRHETTISARQEAF